MRAFENENIYALLFKTRHLNPVETRYLMQCSIVYALILTKLYVEKIETPPQKNS